MRSGSSEQRKSSGSRELDDGGAKGPGAFVAIRGLVRYCRENPGCNLVDGLLGRDFEIRVAGSEAEFSRRVRDTRAEAAVACFCSAREASGDELGRLVAGAGPLPLVACCRTFDPSFVHIAASRGVTHFLLCGMEPKELRRFVLRVMRLGGLRGFLTSRCRDGPRLSPHVTRLIDEIVQAFPRQVPIGDCSRRLGITARRLQAICQDAFGRSYTRLLRQIRVHQALTAMRNTRLDNTQIALWLRYEEGGSLARIFRKELGCSPSEARRRLASTTPEALLGPPKRMA